ncbi:GAF domain-containing protein [Streptomyces spiroverticillatus]|uniref:GAF domain-containing protein n=1 Tax=Streptomyces finlayi TaxID=67296 RepID=A0A918WY83_9ACTN|nr:ANTAR domain-containing protein [Streptomyces finlayi]GHA10582.1 GAF domain-containing protein [Streptomyces spiroverticillatus]GHC95536.1 GAF domain-containing protein [Streptomyces finlayi]
MTALLGELAVRRTAGLDESFARRCAEALGVDGLAVSVSGGSASVSEPVWLSDPVSAALEDLQFTLGEGPALDVRASGALLLDGDLELVPRERWPGFLPAAADLGVRAVFALPLQIGAILLGALTLHRATPGSLSPLQLRDALVLGDTLTLTLLDGSQTAPGEELPVAGLYRAEVHQATGMIAVRLGVPPAAALVRLRAHAYSRDKPILEVARDVVARRLVFTPSGAVRDGDGQDTAR